MNGSSSSSTESGANAAVRSVGIVGTGRAGRGIAGALIHAGYDVALSSRSTEPVVVGRHGQGNRLLQPMTLDRLRVRAGDVILAVPDDAIGEVVERLVSRNGDLSGSTVAHLSGFHGLDVLAPAVAAGADAVAMHPVMTFAGTADDVDRFRGTHVAVTATAGGRSWAATLIADLAGVMFSVAENDRATYHAAIAMAANYVVVLATLSSRLLADVNVPEPAGVLEPIMRAALSNGLHLGENALTGPIARGDLRTVCGHLLALGQYPDEIAQAYASLGHVAAHLAQDAQLLPADAAQAIHEVLGGRS